MTTAAGFALCAAAGALARWWVATRRHRRWRDHLPLPTLVVNVTGAFALGCLVGADVAAPMATVLGTGFLGAYTTFSTFTREAHALATAGDRWPAIAYVALSVTAGVTAALAGMALMS